MSLIYIYHVIEIIIAMFVYSCFVGKAKNSKFFAGGCFFISFGITSLLGYLIDIPLLGRYEETTGKDSLIISVIFFSIGLLLILFFRKNKRT